MVFNLSPVRRNVPVWIAALMILGSSTYPAMAQTNQARFRNRQPLTQKASSSTSANESARTSHRTARQELEAIFAAAKQATTAKQFTDSLRQCKTVYESQISPEDRDYLRKLSSWLYVRRGETYGRAAADAEAKGDLERARLYEQQALKDFTAAIELAPSWRAYHNRGVSHAVLRQFEQALSDFNEAIRTNREKHASSFFNRAEVLYELGRLAEAEQDYSRALLIEPTDAQALLGRAHVKYELGRSDEAIRDFDQAIEFNPKDAVAYADRGDLHLSLGNWAEAAQDFKTAIKLDRSLGRAYQSVAWLMSTCPDPKFRNPDLALRAAQRAMKIDGRTDYRYLDTAAAALANAEEYDDAVTLVKQAMQAAPTEVLPELRQRLAEYEARRPYRDVRR